MAERGVLISSLSKSHAMTGWRCGWAVTSPALARHLANLARATHFGVAQFVQDAAAHAVREGGADLDRLRLAFRSRAHALAEALAGTPELGVRIPAAGMYLFVDVRRTGLDGLSFARSLLDAEGVSVTPGEGFGPSGAGH